MIHWPAVIHHTDDVELTYVHDQVQWQSDADLHAASYEESDCLIDADGHVFGLTKKKDGFIEPEPKGDTMSLEQVLGLVKAHTAQTGACCVAKLYAPTIKDALEMLRAITETS
ncbi:MAG: DUF4144 domain-containing protein [Gammaproteobacteria bacterium]|nr:DUF4144 domain-containing protein [Gammaproteobacteria bacterium]